jgi:hypothetical protein
MPGLDDPLKPLLAALRDLVAWWGAQNVRGIVIGGVAASILGRPRATRDIGALVVLDPSRWDTFAASGPRHRFVPRIADALNFARRSHVLLLRHEPSGVDVDLTFGALPFEAASIARSRKVRLGGLNVPLPAPQDLLVMKAVAGRDRDRADIESILDANPRLDLRRARRLVHAFSEALDDPEIHARFERLLSDRKRRR